MPLRHFVAYLYLALAQTMVGISIVGSKFLVSKINLFHLLALRFSIGTFLIYLVAKMMHSGIKISAKDLTKKDWVYLILQALTAGFFFNILLLLGLKFTSASVAGVLTSTLPAIIFIFSFIFLKEKLTSAKLQCITLALTGLFCINFKNIVGHTTMVGETFFGDMIVMLALIPEASFYILIKIHRPKLPSAINGVWVMGINAVCFIPFAFIQSDIDQLFLLSIFDWIILCTLALSSAMFYVFWSLGSREIEASVASLFTAVMPVATLLIAWAFLGERLSLLQSIGMGLILFSIGVSTRTKRKFSHLQTPVPP